MIEISDSEKIQRVLLIVVGLFMIFIILYSGQRKVWNENCPNTPMDYWKTHENPKRGYCFIDQVFVFTGVLLIIFGVFIGI